MEAAISIMALLVVLFFVAAAYVSVKAVAAAKRGVDRTVAQARRTVEDTTLRARQVSQPGPVGELAQLRLSLRTSMRATQEALRAGAPEDASLSEALGLFERLSAHGHELDDELRRLEREPDRARLTGRLPELRERVKRITGSADSLRWAARDRARQFADEELDSLGRQIEVETGALRHWTSEGVPEAVPEEDGPRYGAPSASSAPGTSSATTGAPASSSSAPPAPQPAEPRPAITARDPRRQVPYSWEKSREASPESSRRPEETT